MAIYTEEQIDRNKLYNEVMQDINDLYSRHGDPVEFETDETRRTTTGTHRKPVWAAGNIGDWDGNEEEVAESANEDLAIVHDGLNLMGHGGIYCRYSRPEWIEFVEAALDILAEYHSTEAYDVLCGCGWS